jgi:chloramphenicol O-acetyltransferase type A
MHTIDLQTWPRRKQFEMFSHFDYPQFGLTAPVDITAFHAYTKQRQTSFTIALIYLFSLTANQMPCFRWRIRGQQVVEHDVVNPSSTVLSANEQISFCTIPFNSIYPAFAAKAAQMMTHCQQHPTLDDDGHDDLLFLSALPWVAFTGLVHPIHMHPVDSVPRISWGKFYPEGERLKMPLSLQAHHALMDGLHLGRYYEQVQTYLDLPESILG